MKIIEKVYIFQDLDDIGSSQRKPAL